MPNLPYVFIPELEVKVISAYSFDGQEKVKYKQVDEGVFVYYNTESEENFDQIIRLTIK
jgi:alpha-L-fucosidase